MKDFFPKKGEHLHIPVGYYCNNFCVFCMEANRQERYQKVKRFIKERIYQVLKENSQIDRVIFAFGEPTLNPQLINYVNYAKKMGFRKIAIISNGRMYAYSSFCQDLIKAGVNQFIVSIHGHSSHLHNSLSRTPGSFEQTSQGLKNLSNFKKIFPLEIITSTVINKINYKFIRDILAFLHLFLIDKITLNVVAPIGLNMGKFFYCLMPRYQEIAYQLEKIVDLEPKLLCPLNSPKHFVSIVDLPLCLSEKLVSLTGFSGIRILEKNNHLIKTDNSVYKTKRKECRACQYFDVCEGVYKNYLKNYGWSEFKPIKI